jgi:hypothetical protein
VSSTPSVHAASRACSRPKMALKSHASVDHRHGRNWRSKRPTIGARLAIWFGP